MEPWAGLSPSLGIGLTVYEMEGCPLSTQLAVGPGRNHFAPSKLVSELLTGLSLQKVMRTPGRGQGGKGVVRVAPLSDQKATLFVYSLEQSTRSHQEPFDF